jgi:membrane protein DedA with SNARE-associated domain
MPLADPVVAMSFTEVLRDLGYVGLVMLLLAETIFPPIPSEAILPLAGYLAESGDFNYVLVLITSTFGTVLGAFMLYEAARRGGRPFAERFLRFARIDHRKLDDADDWFERRGTLVVLFGRCIPGIRSLVSLPAGVLHMSRTKYLLFTTIGSAVWNTILVTLGYLLGTQWEKVSDVIGPFSKPLVAIAIVGGGAFLLWWGLKHRQPKPADD